MENVQVDLEITLLALVLSPRPSEAYNPCVRGNRRPTGATQSLLFVLSAVLSGHSTPAPDSPDASSAWRRGGTRHPLPVGTCSVGSASQSGAIPRSGLDK